MRNGRKTHRRLPIFVLSCLATAALAQTPEAHTPFAPSVFTQTQIRMYQQGPAFEEACRVPYAVHACAVFTVERFTCHCEESEGKWFIVADIDLEVVIHTTGVGFLLHERQHILDIEHAIPAALEPFTSLAILELPTCQNLAHVMSTPSFAVDVMNQLRRESNARYGCRVRKPAQRGPPLAAAARRPH